MYLLWKEYRDIRSVFSSVFVLALGCLWLARFESGWLKLVGIFFILFAMLYAMVLGANAFALERRLGTLDFLLSKPVSRVKIWLTKFGLRLVLLLVPLGVFASVAEFYIAILFPTSFPGLLPLSLLLIFSLCFFFSTMLSQPVTASAAGFTIYLGSLLVFWPLKAFWPFAIFCVVLAVMSVIVSFVLFKKAVVDYS